MINQTYGKTYCDYFTHEYRESAEENVINYFIEKIMASIASMEASLPALKTAAKEIADPEPETKKTK